METTNTINPDPLCFIYKEQIVFFLSKNERLKNIRVKTLNDGINTVHENELKIPEKCHHQNDDGSRGFTCPHRVNGSSVCKSYFCEHYKS